jgi:hypothetical protein
MVQELNNLVYTYLVVILIGEPMPPIRVYLTIPGHLRSPDHRWTRPTRQPHTKDGMRLLGHHNAE